MRRSLFVALVLLLCRLPAGAADYDTLRRQSLRALAPILVAAECSDDLARHSVDCEALARDTMEALEKAGIPVLSAGAKPDPRNRPAFLTLRLTSAKFVGSHTFQLFAVTLALELVQDVLLPRLPNGPFPAVTWSATHTELLAPSRIPELRQDVAELTKQFVASYVQAQTGAR